MSTIGRSRRFMWRPRQVMSASRRSEVLAAQPGTRCGPLSGHSAAGGAGVPPGRARARGARSYAAGMSRRFRFRQVDVFTDRALAGNPLAVFPDATGLTDDEMQALAREMNVSETCFVLPPTPAA